MTPPTEAASAIAEPEMSAKIALTMMSTFSTSRAAFCAAAGDPLAEHEDRRQRIALYPEAETEKCEPDEEQSREFFTPAQRGVEYIAAEHLQQHGHDHDGKQCRAGPLGQLSNGGGEPDG